MAHGQRDVHAAQPRAAIAQVDATLDYWKARAAYELLLAGRSTPLRASALPASTAASSMDAPGH
jgi:hypothetical protein